MKLIAFILLIKWLSTTIIDSQTCSNPIIIFNTKIPQIIDFAKVGFGKGLTIGKKIIIIGTPTNKTDRFAINLGEDGELFKTADVFLHFNPRFDEKVVIRNSWTKENGWGNEANYGHFQYKVGETFVLQFSPYATGKYEGINIDFNNINFASFHPRRRIFHSSLSQLEINGAIKLISITLCGINPPGPLPKCKETIIFPNVNVPVNYDFEKIKFGIGFLLQKKITIIGTPIIDDSGPKNFVINIGESGVMEKNASILFSFNPRFDEKKVVINSWTKSFGWGTETRYGVFPFEANQPFVLELYSKSHYDIYINVNYKFFTSFSRYNLTKVTQIEISRAIKVSSVVFCKKI